MEKIMINFTTGNIWEAKTWAVVVPVNTVGVMGAGLALEAKQQCPRMFEEYKEWCVINQLYTGITRTFTDMRGKESIFRWFVLFPTKKHWKNPSKLEYISNGLESLKQDIEWFHIKSIAIPKLGCGLGGLDWKKIKPIMVESLKDVDCEVLIYE